MKKLLAILLSTVLVASMLVAIIPASANATNVLLGKGVTLGDNTQCSAYTAQPEVITDGVVNTDGWSAAAIDRIDKNSTDTCAYVIFDAFEETTITSAVLTVTPGEGLGTPYEPQIQALIDGTWTFVAWLTGTASTTESYEMTATFEVTTTQVRLAWYAYGWAPIDEFAVYAAESSSEPSTPVEENLALNKGVTLGDNTQCSAYTAQPEVITDGVVNTDGWSAAAIGRIDSASTDTCAYVIIDAFDSAASITSAVLTVTPGEGLGEPYEPQLQALIDGTWTFVAWLTGTSSTTESYEMSATFDAVTTTQVRVAWYAYGWAPIDEFAVYGTYVTEESGSSTPETSDPETTDADLVSGSSVAFENITANGGEGRADTAVITDDVVPGTPVNIWGAGLWYGMKGTDSSVKSYITFDAFDGAYSITDASVALGCDHPSGIGVPGTMALEGLVNGEWVELGTFDMSGVPEWSTESTYVDLYVPAYTVVSDATATQVRLAFYSYGWNWIGEVDVIGTAAETSEPESSEPESSEPESSEPESSEPESSEPESSEPESSEPEITEPSREEEVQELMGEANPDSVYDVIVIAPDKVDAGEEFNVTVSFDNITTPLDSVSAYLYFDSDYVTLQDALNGFAIPDAWNVVTGKTDEWEDFTRVEYDTDKNIIPGLIALENGTAGDDGSLQSLTETGVLTYTFTFVASADATEIAFYIPHDSVTAMEMMDYTEYVGNGSYKIVTVVADSSDDSSEPESSEPESSEPESSEPESSEPESSEPESSEPESSEPESSEPESSEPESSEPESSEPESSEPESSEPESSEPESSEPESSEPSDSEGSTSEPESSDTTETPDTGDASSILVFVVLALVALAGSAVVIKSRK